jgi:hypothetical protein
MPETVQAKSMNTEYLLTELFRLCVNLHIAFWDVMESTPSVVPPVVHVRMLETQRLVHGRRRT